MLSDISISSVSDNLFKVKVTTDVQTNHFVSVTDSELEKLSKEKTKEELILFAFRFLLKREKNTQILQEFSISLINNYFPDFEREVKKWLET